MRTTFKIIVILMLAICGVTSCFGDTVQAASAWHSDENGWWYQEDNWYPSNQWYEIGGAWYYFGANGYIETSAYRDGCWIDSSGAWDQSYSGGHWASDSVGYWYTDSSGWYPTSTWLWIDGRCYYFKSNGYMAVNEWVGSSFVGANGAWIPGQGKAQEATTNMETTTNLETTNNIETNANTGNTHETATKDNNQNASKKNNETKIVINWDFNKESSSTASKEEVKEEKPVSKEEVKEEKPVSKEEVEETKPASKEEVEATQPVSKEEVEETPTVSSEVVESLILTAEGKEASLTLGWNPISEASGYRVFLGKDKNSLSQVSIQSSREDVTITFGYMTAGTYYAKVVGFKDDNGSKVDIIESNVVKCEVTSKPKTTQPSAQDSSGSATMSTTTTPTTTQPTTTPESSTTTPSTTTTSSPETKPQVTLESKDSIIKNVFAKTNEIRRSVGKKSLQTSAVLSVIAQKRAEHMVQNNYFSHYYDGKSQVIYWRDYYGYSKDLIIGENIAKVYPGEDTSGVAMEAWINSPGHYSNIIDSDYVTTGIGVAEYGDGMYAVVQVFSGGSDR